MFVFVVAAEVHVKGLEIRRNEILLIKGNKMTISNALSFIKRSLYDEDLRSRLNGTSNKEDLERVLAEEYLNFSAHDFDEAYHHKLTECKVIDEAEQLKELKLWWDLLGQILEPPACKVGCSGCC